MYQFARDIGQDIDTVKEMPLLKTYKWMIALTLLNDAKTTRPPNPSQPRIDPEDGKWERRIVRLPNGKFEERM